MWFLLKETDGLEKGIWMQDFPRKEKGSGASSGDFEETLVDYVKHLGNATFSHHIVRFLILVWFMLPSFRS